MNRAKKSFFSTLLRNEDTDEHFIIVTADTTEHSTVLEAHLEAEKQEGCSGSSCTILGVFAGIMQPLTYSAPLSVKNLPILAPSALKLDQENSKDLTIDFWTKVCEDYYVASVHYSGSGNSGVETLEINFIEDRWWLQDSRCGCPSDFLLLTQALEAGNEAIKEIEAEFNESLEPA